MAQYNVHLNPRASAGDGIPYAAVIQSDLLDALSTGLTMPMAAMTFAGRVPSALCPLMMVKGQQMHALVHFAAPLPVKLLREPVNNVAAQASALVAAMGGVLSGTWIGLGCLTKGATRVFLLPTGGPLTSAAQRTWAGVC
jgi:toxin CcdB